MSLYASIDISFNELEQRTYVDIFNMLLSSNWKNSLDKNYIMLLPGDIDYSWESYSNNLQEVKKVLESKEKHGEIGGIQLYYDNKKSGVEILFFSSNEISISLSINRKVKFGNHTDIEWYIKNLILPLEEKFDVTSFKFEEVK